MGAVTAINFSKPHLNLVTLYRGGTGRLEIDVERTARLELDGRGAAELREIQKYIRTLLRQWRVRRLVMRVGPDKGPYVLNPLAYKLEAALHLMTNLDVESLTVAEVSGFARRYDEDLPELREDVRNRAAQTSHLNAMRTAGLALVRAESGA